METLTKVSEVLEAAQCQLIANGWIQGALGRTEGPNCAAGALYAIRHAREVIPFGLIVSAADKFLSEFVYDCYSRNMQGRDSLTSFNDTAKSFDEVKWLYDEAIAEAKELEDWDYTPEQIGNYYNVGA